MGKRKSPKLRDLGRRKSKEVIKSRVAKTREVGARRQYEDLRLKAKRANERMRQLEKAGIESPAYQAIQARLEILGKERKGTRGRRFSESGRATYQERQILNKILNEFLFEQTTSTVKGARDYYDDVWASANKNNKLDAAGISREGWFNFWENMPSDKQDRMYGSSTILNLVQAYTFKNKELEPENKLSMEEIADAIQNSKDYKSARIALGLTQKEVTTAGKSRKLGRL